MASGTVLRVCNSAACLPIHCMEKKCYKKPFEERVHQTSFHSYKLHCWAFVWRPFVSFNSITAQMSSVDSNSSSRVYISNTYCFIIQLLPFKTIVTLPTILRQCFTCVIYRSDHFKFAFRPLSNSWAVYFPQYITAVLPVIMLGPCSETYWLENWSFDL